MTTGSGNAGTCVDDATVGTASWTNPTNAQGACDTVNATNAALGPKNGTCTATTGHYLKATNFGFAIPAGSTVQGIQVTVRRKSDGNNTCVTSCGCGNCVDNSVKLVKGGVIGGTDEKDGTTKWPTSLGDKTYGTISDLWGLGWTAADINDSTFGVAISPVCTVAGTGSATFVLNIAIDCFTITVTYIAGGKLMTVVKNIIGI